MGLILSSVILLDSVFDVLIFVLPMVDIENFEMMEMATHSSSNCQKVWLVNIFNGKLTMTTSCAAKFVETVMRSLQPNVVTPGAESSSHLDYVFLVLELEALLANSAVGSTQVQSSLFAVLIEGLDAVDKPVVMMHFDCFDLGQLCAFKLVL